MIKKNCNVPIDHDIARPFKGYNILEFKSEHDSLSIDDLYKTMGYGCLYKAYGHRVNAIDADDATITLTRRRRPVRLFNMLKARGNQVESTAPGVYLVKNLVFPTQVVVTGELNPTTHVWLASLASDLWQNSMAK